MGRRSVRQVLQRAQPRTPYRQGGDMHRRDALHTLLTSLASAPNIIGAPATTHAPGSAPPQKPPGGSSTRHEDTLFPTNLPSRDWKQFRAEGFSHPACGVIYRRDRPPERGIPLGAIDTGRINLEHDGRFGHCTIYNSFCPQRGPLDAPFLAL